MSLPRSIWMLCVAMLINRMGTMAIVFLSLHITKNLRYPLTTAGLVMAVYGATALLAGPFAGKLSDKIGAVLVVELSLCLSGLTLLLYPFVSSLSLILVMTVVLSATSESFRPACMALLGDLTPPGQRALSQALYRLAINVGMSVGPALGGFLALISYKWIFWVDGVTCLLSFAFLFLTSFHKEARRVHHSKKVVEILSASVFKNRTFILYLLAMLPLMMTMFQFSSTFPIYVVKELGFPESSYGFLCLVNTIAVVLIEIPMVMRLQDAKLKTLLSLGSLFYAVGFGSLVLAQQMWSLSLSVLIWTFGEIFFMCSSMAYVTQLAPAHKRGEYMGFYSMAFALAFTVAPFLGTVAMEHLGSVILWGLTFVFGILSVLLLQKVVKPEYLLKGE